MPVRTTWTLLLYLTSAADGCRGGETVFYPHDRRSVKEEIAVPPETGMLLLHKHGDDCMLVSPYAPSVYGNIAEGGAKECTARRPRGKIRREMGSANRPLCQAIGLLHAEGRRWDDETSPVNERPASNRTYAS